MIRRAHPTDARRIAEIKIASWRVAYRGIIPDDHLAALDIGAQEKIWQGVCEDADSRLLVASADGGTVGFCHVGPSRDKGGRKAAEITAIYLDPDYWRKGHGRELVTAAISYAAEHHFSKITLWVLCENDAAKLFYEAMGFFDDGTTRAVERGGATLRQKRYRRELDQPLGFLENLPPAGEPRFWEISQGRRLAWNEYGDPQGQPVMYYHGWPSSRLQARLAHHLARERGLRLIAMDRPGMGRSTLERGRSLDSWPELMERFADHLGIGKFGQLGVSGGGPYVFACAAKIPERLSGSAVLGGMVPVDGLECGVGGLHLAYRTLIPFRKLPAGIFTPVFRAAALGSRLKPGSPPLSWALRTVGEEDRRLMLDFPDVWSVMTQSFEEGVSTHGGPGVMTDAEIYFQPLSVDLAEVRHPIRYWHGGDDRNIPLEMVREFTGKMPGAELMVDEPLGHFSLVMRRAPAALDYLALKFE
jgi:pimeloyl-ACP methyl ester carboxylesterase/ribosomal protein S18 acetylase RimI-like enzyme